MIGGAGRSPRAGWDRLLELDAESLWHPYSSLPATIDPLGVISAQGVRLRLADGRELIDGMSSWWCAIHGYKHELLDRALRNQLQRMAHVMFGGLTHEPAILLAERLLELTPTGLEHVFFSDSGSVAVEVAIKMCLQFQQATSRPERNRLLTVRGGYHGDTFGAMAVCDPIDGMHRLFAGVLPQHLFADRPPEGFDAELDHAWAEHVEGLIGDHAHELAAVILEPVVQGAGGMRFHSPLCVSLLRRCCDEHGLLLVLDEIATGFGRTGAMFACEHAGVSPDVMCLGKALTGGYLSLAATLCTANVAHTISAGEGKALMHGPTFMANPLACAAGLASTELLLEGGWSGDVQRIEHALTEGLQPAARLPQVADVRVLGAIGVIELHEEVNLPAATAAAIDRGVWIRPFRNLIYTMPAYLMCAEDLSTLTDALVAAAGAGPS